MHIVTEVQSLVVTPLCFMDLEGLRRIFRAGDIVRVDIFREPFVPNRELRTKVDKQRRTATLHIDRTELDGQRLLIKGRLSEGHQTAVLRLGQSLRLCFRDPDRQKFLSEFITSDMIFDVLALDASTAFHVKVGQSAVVVKEYEIQWSGDVVANILAKLSDFNPKLVIGLGLIGAPVAKARGVPYLTDSQALTPPFVPGSKTILQLLSGIGAQRDRAISAALLKARDDGRLQPLGLLDTLEPRVRKIYLFEGNLDQIADPLLSKTILVDPRYEGYRPLGDVLELYAR
jgi:hypothetical protein